MAQKNDLRALRGLIAETKAILDTVALPEGRAERARELVTSALFLADHLIDISPAAALGAKGGKQTAKRGPDYFRKIASQRKTRAGGRPKKTIN